MTDENKQAYANRGSRITAFFLDSLLLITCFYFIGRIIWEFVPEAEVVYGSMIAYDPKEWKVYSYTAVASTALVVVYNCFLPMTRMRSTFGGYVARIQTLRPDREPIRLIESVRIFMVLLIKCALIFALGPLLAILTQNFVVSLFGLFCGIAILIISSLIAQSQPEGALWWEQIGGYRYFSV